MDKKSLKCSEQMAMTTGQNASTNKDHVMWLKAPEHQLYGLCENRCFQGQEWMCFTHSASCKLQRISSTFIAVKTYLNVKKDILFPIMDYLSQVNFHISVNWFLNTIVKGMETIAASMVENILKTLKHNRKFGITCHIFHMCKNTGMVL